MSPADLYILGLDVEFDDVVESNGARSAHRREMLGNIKNSECGSVCWARHAFFWLQSVYTICAALHVPGYVCQKLLTQPWAPVPMR